MAPRYAVSDADDPFKKYWWAILAGIGFTAMWLLMPMLGEKSIGSTSIDTSKPKVDENVEQSFSAEGEGGTYLSMEDAIKKRKEDPTFGSSLMLPTPEGGETPADGKTAGLGAASGAGSSGSLASALKQVAADNGGWGEKKAQRGFDQPKLSGSGMSGLGAASGGRSGSAGGGTSAFGSSNANIGFGRAGGLSGSVKDDVAPAAKGSIAALQAMASKSVAGANNSSNDAARSSLSQAFDGAKGGSKIGGPGAGMGRYATLDTAPINLKLADPKLNEKKLEAPPMTDMGESKTTNQDAELAKQLMMTVVGGVIGGMIGGPAGGIVTNVIMQAVQRQEAQQKKVEEMEQKMLERQEMRRRGLNPGPSTGSGS